MDDGKQTEDAATAQDDTDAGTPPSGDWTREAMSEADVANGEGQPDDPERSDRARPA